MELKIDLLRKKDKDFWDIGFGVFYLFGSILYFIMWRGNVIKASILSGGFALCSIAQFIRGLGYSIERFFGEAYILINSEIISLKSSIYKKEKIINWNEVKSVSYSPISSEFIIRKTDDITYIINVSEFDYLLLAEFQKIIGSIAKEKNIQANI